MARCRGWQGASPTRRPRRPTRRPTTPRSTAGIRPTPHRHLRAHDAAVRFRPSLRLLGHGPGASGSLGGNIRADLRRRAEHGEHPGGAADPAGPRDPGDASSCSEQVSDPASWPIIEEIIHDPLFDVGNHTWSHVDMADASIATATAEMDDTAELARHLRRPPSVLPVPVRRFDLHHPRHGDRPRATG